MRPQSSEPRQCGLASPAQDGGLQRESEGTRPAVQLATPLQQGRVCAGPVGRSVVSHFPRRRP